MGDGWSPPANVGVSYHWFHADGQVLKWDYSRTSVPRWIQPGDSALMFLRVWAPEQPGRYLIQPDLVEDGVSWFSQHCPMEKWEVVVEGP